MTGEHFTLDVHPGALRRVAGRLDAVREMLSRRGPLTEATPDEIGEQWTGDASVAVKAEMGALGRELTRYVRLHHEASDALRLLARRYDAALDRLPGLNRRWTDAHDRHAEHDPDDPGDSDTEADTELDRRTAALTETFEEIVADLRRDTLEAGRALAAAMAVPRPPRRGVVDDVVPTSHGSWHVQTRAALADTFRLTALRDAAADPLHQPPAEWRDYAEQYDLAVPDEIDRARGLELAAELDRVLAANAHRDAGDRSAAVNGWAASLDPEDLTMLAMVDPARVGNLDGMPNDVRYAANKVTVLRAVDSERERLAGWLPPPRAGDDDWAAYQRLQRRISTLDDLLHDDAVSGSTDVGDYGREHYQVLVFEPPTYAGDRVVDDGRLAVTVGDLDTARDVGVVVPGITNRIDNFTATLDKAYSTQTSVPGSATIAWLGYDTPEFEDSVTTDDAERGALALRDFVEGMVRDDESDVVVMAHSYGTLVTATALRNGMRPDRVVLFGSPGLGEGVHSTADLGLPDGYPIFALRAPGDPVSITAAHGDDPADMPGVIRLDAHDVSGHSSYTQAGSLSLLNIAAVLAGNTDPQGQIKGYTTTDSSLADEGFLGPYNENLRALVDELQDEVPAEVLSRFITGVQQDVQNISEGGDLPWRDLPGRLRQAADESGIRDHLSSDELGQALRDAGFVGKTGDLARDQVEDFFDDRDELDDLPIPIPRPGGGPPIIVTLPDGLNEALGRGFGELTDRGVTFLGDELTEHVPSLETVLDVAELGVDTADTLIGAWHAAREVPGLVRDGSRYVVEETWEGTKDLAGQAADGAESVVRSLVPGI